MSFLVLPIEQIALARKALAALEGLPRQATVYIDENRDLALSAQLGTVLNTTDVLGDQDTDGALACVDFPASLERHLGKTVDVDGQSITLPTLAELAPDEAALPETLRSVLEAKRNISALP
jgi:hypothetical protein